jgi:hypothetical protein
VTCPAPPALPILVFGWAGKGCGVGGSTAWSPSSLDGCSPADHSGCGLGRCIVQSHLKGLMATFPLKRPLTDVTYAYSSGRAPRTLSAEPGAERLSKPLLRTECAFIGSHVLREHRARSAFPRDSSLGAGPCLARLKDSVDQVRGKGRPRTHDYLDVASSNGTPCESGQFPREGQAFKALVLKIIVGALARYHPCGRKPWR